MSTSKYIFRKNFIHDYYHKETYQSKSQHLRNINFENEKHENNKQTKETRRQSLSHSNRTLFL